MVTAVGIRFTRHNEVFDRGRSLEVLWGVAFECR